MRLREAELAGMLGAMGEGAEFTFGGWEAPLAVAEPGHGGAWCEGGR